MQYRAWQAASAILRRLPRRVAYAIAAAIGAAAFYVWPRGRRATLHNFARVLPGAPPGELRRVARSSLVNYCRYLADFIRFPAFSRAELIAGCRGDASFAGLDCALDRGKGAIIVCMHFGNWDFGAGAAAARGYPVTVIAETFRDARLNETVVGARRRLGMKVVAMERTAPSILRSLKSNGLLALLIDRPVPGEGVRAEFFGEEIEVPAGPARLALRSGAAVIPAAFARAGRSGHVNVLTDFGVQPVCTGDEDADVRSLTQAILHAHERFIRAHPDQWYMFREMWPRQSAVVPVTS
ncbi:MAG: lysophospholipid acyltransferase family protein [Chloroflexi bacterium]|nr:lysophospholipid acyltransferase family protein [Chloroflexota bacterium]